MECNSIEYVLVPVLFRIYENGMETVGNGTWGGAELVNIATPLHLGLYEATSSGFHRAFIVLVVAIPVFVLCSPSGFVACSKGRTLSVVWSCRSASDAMRKCLASQ